VVISLPLPLPGRAPRGEGGGRSRQETEDPAEGAVVEVAVVLMLQFLWPERDEWRDGCLTKDLLCPFLLLYLVIHHFFVVFHSHLSLSSPSAERSQLLLCRGKRTDSWRRAGRANERAESRWIGEREKEREGERLCGVM